MIVQHSRLLYPDGDGNIQSQRRVKPYGKQNTRRIQTMTNKAKTYLKNIQEADTEKKLIGIEIAFKQDMTLSLQRSRKPLQGSAEDRRYSLRNNEGNAEAEADPFLPDESGDGCLPRHEPQAGRLDSSGDRAAKKPLLQQRSGRSSRKRSWSMSTRLGRKPTPTPNSTQRYTPRKIWLCLVSDVFYIKLPKWETICYSC